MIYVCYVTSSMISKYVMAGLRVAQDIGGVTVTVQPPGMFSEETAVISVEGRNMQIIDIDYIGASEHAARLYDAIMKLKGGE